MVYSLQLKYDFHLFKTEKQKWRKIKMLRLSESSMNNGLHSFTKSRSAVKFALI